jgi:hypothetical protein
LGAEIKNLYGAQGKPSVVVLEKRRKLNRNGGFDARDLIMNLIEPYRCLIGGFIAQRSALSFEPIYERAGVSHGQTKPVFWLHAFLDNHHRNHLLPPLPTLLNGVLARCG